jgi:AhpD family alkylhydroperoxidase
MSQTAPIDMQAECPDILTALGQIEQLISERDIDAQLKHLVKLHASQINGCAYCVKMHTQEARRDGETNERLDRLIVWHHCDDYSPAERAALAWTEALTISSSDASLGDLRQQLRRHFSNSQIATLTSIIAMINLWNRIGLSQH